MKESIFGVEAPKVVLNYGQPEETSINLNYWISLSEELETKEIIHESELEADREIIPRGEFLTLQGRINLYKYKQMNLILNKYNEIMQINKKKVVLYKHRDGDFYKDLSDNPIYFFVNIQPKNLTSLDVRDVLYITFRALSGTNSGTTGTIEINPDDIIINGGVQI
jgi:hypothetical protein